jgi:hypothetical protein
MAEGAVLLSLFCGSHCGFQAFSNFGSLRLLCAFVYTVSRKIVSVVSPPFGGESGLRAQPGASNGW